MPAAYEKSVFINCPFNKAFEPLFHAIVFTIATLGEATVIGKVASWLSVQLDFRPPAPNAKAILGAYPKLCERLKEARANALGNLICPEITAAAAAVAADLRV